MYNVQLQVQQKADNLNYHEVQCKSLGSQKGKTEKEKKNRRRRKKDSLIMTIQIFGLHMSHVTCIAWSLPIFPYKIIPTYT